VRLSIAILCATSLFAQRQAIERYELRPAADGLRLYITIEGEDRLISNRATKAWDGWTPQVIIYAERATSETALQRLRWYDTFTRNSYTISTGEPLEYTDVVPVRLSTGEYVLVVSLRDPEGRVPWVELASPRGGVVIREQYAAWGTAADDRAQLRRYRPEDIDRTKGDISLLAPDVIANVPIAKTPEFGAAGLYEFATQEKTITLNLRPGGTGTLVVQEEGKGQPRARQGKWTQTGREVQFEGMTWVAGLNGLTPKIWDRQEFGVTGLPLRRAGR
jgi:hypothetical protein